MRRCPACGHQGARRSHRFPGEKLVTTLLPVRPYRCKSCNHRFWWMSSETAWQRAGRQGLIALVMVLVVGIGLVYVTNLPERNAEPVPTPAGAQRVEPTPPTEAADPAGPPTGEPTPTQAPGPTTPTPEPAQPAPAPTPSTDPGLVEATTPDWVAPERPTDPRTPEMLGLRVRQDGQALVIEILTDERPRHWDIYPIDRRLVIDLQGPWQARRLVAPPLNHSLFVRARIGQHEDLVRVVVDLTRQVEVRTEVTPRDDALVVRLESAETSTDG